MNGGDFGTFKLLVRERVEAQIYAALCGKGPAARDGAGPEQSPVPRTVQQVAWYAARGGHRWRAMVSVATGLIFTEDALEVCLPVGAGIELAHAASLVLDDLPTMDDGKLRRGRPCAHIQFSNVRWAVDMAPVYMINVAYRLGLENRHAGLRERVATALEMSRTSTVMIAGQELDVTRNVDGQTSSDERMLECYLAKSGSLYGAAAKVAAITCGGSEAECSALYEAGKSVGLAYQLMDDVCDVTATSFESGKNPGQDAHKEQTAVALYGLAGTRARAQAYQEAAIDRLAEFGQAAETLRELARNASWAPV